MCVCVCVCARKCVCVGGGGKISRRQGMTGATRFFYFFLYNFTPKQLAFFNHNKRKTVNMYFTSKSPKWGGGGGGEKKKVRSGGFETRQNDE